MTPIPNRGSDGAAPNRRRRVLRNVAIGVLSLILIVFIGAVTIVQTDWFRNYVREKLITATEDATGGRVEIQSVSFDWRRFQAVVDNFVLHGTERAGSPPLLRVARVQVNIRLFTSLKRLVSVSFLGIERPDVNILVAADGRTNFPSPKQRNPEPLETVVDLAVSRFRLSNGLLRFDSRAMPMNVRPMNIEANNLAVELAYNLLRQSYEGNMSLQPVYVVEGRNTPVVVSLNLPVTLEKDRVRVNGAKLVSPTSELNITAAVENMQNPKTSARVNGHISVDELNRIANLNLASDAWGKSSAVQLDVDALIANNTIQVSRLYAKAGSSVVEAVGFLKDGSSNSALTFTTNVNLPEITRLIQSNRQLNGTVALDGTATMSGARIDVAPFHLRAFGAELTGTGSLEDYARYQVTGTLRGMDLQTVEQRFGIKPLPYSGVLAGQIEARGDFKSKTNSTVANANLTIAPGGRGIALSGKLDAAYGLNGTGDAVSSEVQVNNSRLVLPHSRLNFSGSIRRGIQIDLTSSDLADLMAPAEQVHLNGGEAHLTALVTGNLNDPRIKGHLTADRVVFEDRQFDALATDFDAQKSNVALANGSLNRATMTSTFAGSVGLTEWSPKPANHLSLAANVRNGDIADLIMLAGKPSKGYSGSLEAAVNIGGTIGNPTGSASIQAANGAIMGEPFDHLQAQVHLADQLVRISTGYITQGTARMDLSGDYHHAHDSFTTGVIHARLQGNQIDLNRLRSLQSRQPTAAGVLQFRAEVTGDLANSDFRPTNVNADISARALRLGNENYGDLTAKATTSRHTVSYNVTSNFAGSQINAQGRTQLATDYPTDLDVTLSDLPVERVLAVAKRTDIPAKGRLAATAHLSGTLKDPQGTADLDLTAATIYDEPLDRVQARLTYAADSIDLQRLDIAAGPSRVSLTGRFDHPRNSLEQGNMTLRLGSSRIDLARIRNVQKIRPGLGGVLELSLNGQGMLEAASPRVLVKDLTAKVNATGLAAEGRTFGNLDLTANTANNRLNFTLTSGLANASIQGHGEAELTGKYPVNAELTFKDLTWASLQPLLQAGEKPSFEVAAAGQVSIQGSATDLSQLSASVRLTTLSASATANKNLVLGNQGDVALRLNNGVVRIDSAHITGPQTDINATGTASMRDKRLDLRVNANSNLALLKTINADIFSSGTVAVNASVQGTMNQPQVTGRAELKSASVSYADLPAGIENANGVILFNGDTATIQTLTGNSGGGTIALSGFVTRRNTMRFSLRANTRGVRVRAQEGVSVVANANLTLAGATDNSALTGNVNIQRVSYAPQSDIGSLLSRSGPPVETPVNPSDLLQNMRLDILVRTTSATAFQSSLAQNLQVDADVRVRGRASQPGATGTISLTQGNLVFFGSTYKINSGTISFYNPNRIEPILEIALETQSKGVNVVLSVTGPIDNMKLSYTSDPPLQFDEIVALLATGKAPTSDPTLLANQPSQPQQNLQQRGESALVGKALADPLSSRLERVFGVSQLKIDPTFTGSSQLPQARVTLQQQVATNLLFTYVTALDDPNTQIVRIEWAMNPQWSAAANRDENGSFSVSLLYKKQFR
jgi:translocation and assembly module TamB